MKSCNLLPLQIKSLLRKIGAQIYIGHPNVSENPDLPTVLLKLTLITANFRESDCTIHLT